MRTIEFRGKRLDNGEWVYGFYVVDKDGNHVIVEYANWKTFTFSCYNVDPKTVGQRTDNTIDGKAVWEGDVVRFDVREGQNGENAYYGVQGVVEWSKNEFRYASWPPFWCVNTRLLGNIHDHPELNK